MANYDASADTIKWACETAVRFALEIDAARALVELTMPNSVQRLVMDRNLNRANNRLVEFLGDLELVWGVDPQVALTAIAGRANTN